MDREEKEMESENVAKLYDDADYVDANDWARALEAEGMACDEGSLLDFMFDCAMCDFSDALGEIDRMLAGRRAVFDGPCVKDGVALRCAGVAEDAASVLQESVFSSLDSVRIYRRGASVFVEGAGKGASAVMEIRTLGDAGAEAVDQGMSPFDAFADGTMSAPLAA